MLRLRMGLMVQDLAFRFQNSCGLVSQIFTTWVKLLCKEFKFLVLWPSKADIRQSLPESFKRYYPKTRALIDCAEVFMETPSSLDTQRRAFAQIRKQGIYEKNLTLLQQGKPSVRERRFGNTQDVKMCGGCHRFFSSKQIYRHKQVCDMSEGIRGGAVDLKKAVAIASLDISEELRDMVKCFRDDQAGYL
ncbi:THAP domain-containing protein 4 [Elysia marginata]|uniref:THAP domain-containing protein 4 n=1 Tax=Elysia marginata TaxID=1093978 RepID=A0AAV4FBN3_9GAST|nr:THAP domain-containing protein 4 [Elysia marginata]